MIIVYNIFYLITNIYIYHIKREKYFIKYKLNQPLTITSK